MVTTSISTQGPIRNYWWVLLLEGLAALAFGLFLFFQPAATLVVLTTFMGAYWLVDGIFKVIGAFTGKSGDRSWWLLLLAGLLAIIGGLVVLSQPLLSTLVTQLFFVYFLAVQAIIGGILSIFWAIRARKEISGEGWLIVGGLLAIVFGVLLFSAPLISILTLAWITAIAAVVGGIVQIFAAFRLRS
jgi:uncharacterized membrane protein HdeD (DUF308 family)